ncbi:Outer membrane protein TolC [Chitinophaga sp. CF118]|uniref:TolC family protein n=1 Tax=Chitinophaga sp. CF118 TaxID=1884367 RepID=UPI0008F319EF|nr:TolC family protein [Chitinophaga sp. CF118]SFE41143.1 Outer membrane protein TolC [Chitinophaga sp. CF118]
MQRKKVFSLFVLLVLYGRMEVLHAQVLTLKDAVQTALTNYGSIKAKANYANASKESATQAKRDYLPNVNLSAQQDYGTVNGQFGPSYGLNGLGVASSGPTLSSQNSNAAFGGLYLANVNWDFFAFGRSKEKIKTAQAVVARDESDSRQEQFQQEVKVAAAYLNLLAAQRLTNSWQKNLVRADTFRFVVVTRVKNGLIPGVDSSLANAEVSSARIAYTKAKDFEQTQANQLAQLMGIPPQDFILDTLFVTRIPSALLDSASLQDHPLLKYYKSRINLSDEQAKYYHTLNFPSFSLFGVMQTRGSGFSSSYATDQTAYTKNYWDGIKPNRSNYLVGVGVTWNITTPLRVSHQVKSQRYISKGLQDEYDLVQQQLNAQLVLAGTRIKNALDNYREAPIQVNSASDAYLQRTVLYKNGLTNIVDVTQVSYTLNRAETDRDIAYANVWQALLLKAAASGNFSLFINEF